MRDDAARPPYTPHVITWLTMLMTGCFQPIDELSSMDTTKVPFENPYITSDDVFIRLYTSALSCPGGEDARFYIVSRDTAAEDAPVAVVLHSGAFDYVLERSDDGPLDGPHYRTSSRLSADFGTAKVFETLGMQVDDLDPSEDNMGTLPAVLADRGFVQLIPANCWGDLWHNEAGPIYYNAEIDGFQRNGRALAWDMVELASNPDMVEIMGLELDFTWNHSELYLIGLGEGGRGVAELLAREDLPAVTGALVDSAPDDLGPYLKSPDSFADEIEGLARIFPSDDAETISDWSLAHMAEDITMPTNMVYLWSDGDTRLPAGSMSGAANVLANMPGPWVVNTREPGHVISNSDLTRAREIVDFLQTGIKPSSD